jgi:hypothetical protein
LHARKRPLANVQKGQQATLTGASRIFALTVRNRELNPAAVGRGCVKTHFARRVGSLTGELELIGRLKLRSTWLTLTVKKRSREFSHSLGQIQSVAPYTN